MLLDDKGNTITPDLTKVDVLKRLQEFAPQNKEQERVLATKIAQSVEYQRKNRMNKGIDTGFDGTFKENAERRVKSDGYTDDRGYRMIAQIPRDMAVVAQEMFGDDVLTDPDKFREAFIKDETGRYCLTVDPKTI